MKSENITTLLSLACIIVAFFLWYAYAAREYEINNIQEENIYIDITTSQKNITIKNTPENVFFRVDKQLIQSWSIDLK